MADEKKAAEPKQQKAPEAAPQAAQAPAQAPEAATKKNKKISLMNLKEVEEKMGQTKEKMGRLDSRYGKELLKKKEALTKK